LHHFHSALTAGRPLGLFRLFPRLFARSCRTIINLAMRNRITVNPQIHFGKPCVAGTRIPVQDVLELLQEGLSFEEITREYYRDLTADDIRACIQYAREVIAAEDLHVSAS
jgi:uncharacterized protein (DUF433 family)